jgi:hypothetical protein
MPYPSDTLYPSTTLYPSDPIIAPPPVVLPSTRVPWRFVIVAAENGLALGEPLATGRQVDLGVSQGSTASFRVRSGTSLWSEVLAGDTMLKVYDSTHTLVFYGEIITDELSATGQGGSVALTASDLSWRLEGRLTGKDFEGVGDEYVDRDSGLIVFDALDQVNGEQPTGIVKGNRDSFVNRTMTLLWKNVLELLNELGAIASSYEWRLRYVDGTPPAVYLDLLTLVGEDKSDTVFFEYGMGLNNCNAYSRTRSMQSLATRVYALGGGGSFVAEAYDSGAETIRRVERQLTYQDITTPSMVDALAAAHVTFRSRPRRVVRFTPTVNTGPQFGEDWRIGDFVTARAQVSDVVDVNGRCRIWGASISIDENGNELATPRMEPDAS